LHDKKGTKGLESRRLTLGQYSWGKFGKGKRKGMVVEGEKGKRT